MQLKTDHPQNARSGCHDRKLGIPERRTHSARVSADRRDTPPIRLLSCGLLHQFLQKSYSGRIEKPEYPSAPISGPSRPATSSSAETRIGQIQLLNLNHT